MFQGSFVPVLDWFRIGLSSVSYVSLGTGFASVYLTFIVVHVRFDCMFRTGLDGLFRSGPVPVWNRFTMVSRRFHGGVSLQVYDQFH